MATTLLEFYLDKTQQEPTLAQCIALVSLAAYLKSLQEILARTENHHLLERIGETPVSELLEQQIKQLGELELDDQEARKALVSFHESQLAATFNEVLSARLLQAGLSKAEAQILTERVARSTYRYLIQALAEAGNSVKWVVGLYRDQWRRQLEKYQSIDVYLEEQIAAKPHETVFAESFTFRDIYVPLKAKPVDKNDDINEETEAFDLETWAKDALNDPQKQDRVIFIQGEPGRGKSVFCRMFADGVRQHLHPIWTPVLIRLRDIPKLQPSFRETLREAVQADFATNDEGWLTDRNTRFLFLLDGFDELGMEGTTSGLEEFLKQVGQFQQDCQRSKDMGHRVLITGRSLALHSIERFMPHNLERVEIQPMDDELQKKWCANWGKLVGTKPTHLLRILQDERFPDRLQELTREPLLLYLIAAMHRDGELKLKMFEGVEEARTKILIYEKTLDWVLTKQRPEWLNRQLTGMQTAELQHILAEAALCVVQSGGECAAMEMVKKRIKDNDVAAWLIRDAQERLGDDALKNALAAFYLQPAKGDKGGSVEFAHKSFSEFLFAQRLTESLEEWTVPGRRGEEFLVKNAQMAWEIYDLLGYGGLTPEIVEYLMGLLTTTDEFRPVHLFKRLENFYLPWCDGEFIDALQDNYPQKKMSQLQGQEIKLGLRQVDAYAGLNVMILLLELHRYAQSRDDLKDKIVFYPCGQKDTEGFDKDRLFCLIGYSYCIDVSAFLDTVGSFLSGSNLSGVDLISAYLREVNLSGADLSNAILDTANFIDANLSSATLSGATLSGATLSGATLSGANLSGATLDGANLIDANLIDADLNGADLSHATLDGANLIDADLSGADLKDISWDEDTNWEDIRGLETAINVSETLKQRLGLE